MKCSNNGIEKELNHLPFTVASSNFFKTKLTSASSHLSKILNTTKLSSDKKQSKSKSMPHLQSSTPNTHKAIKTYTQTPINAQVCTKTLKNTQSTSFTPVFYRLLRPQSLYSPQVFQVLRNPPP